MALIWSLEVNASSPDLVVVSEGVFSHGRSLAVGGNATPLACLVRDADVVVAGGSGRTEFKRLFINCLWVALPLRGQGIGSNVLATLEAEAVSRGCKDALIETLSDEAATMYSRRGYEVVATVPNYVGKFTRYILVKPGLTELEPQ